MRLIEDRKRAGLSHVDLLSRTDHLKLTYRKTPDFATRTEMIDYRKT